MRSGLIVVYFESNEGVDVPVELKATSQELKQLGVTGLVAPKTMPAAQYHPHTSPESDKRSYSQENFFHSVQKSLHLERLEGFPPSLLAICLTSNRPKADPRRPDTVTWHFVPKAKLSHRKKMAGVPSLLRRQLQSMPGCLSRTGQ